ncbi:FAD synthase [Drosophila hydei]|uniref:FAD synthase n=1 Tax=Drosophila hydei TaxID=7224 RepID=A0A6J1LCB9_DROHY|nr:FAD synthase [Drosophila hydei]XP_023161978.2 FAD synthase [Drosophila hydei]XP_023161979.2 FAD synthase [Drosophila hydei]
MHKCCIQTQQATLTKSTTSIVETVYSKKKIGSICNGIGNSIMSSCHNNDGDDDHSADDAICPVVITEATRAHIRRRVRTAFDFFDQTLMLYKIVQLIFCFNGGKDCTVLLDLLMRYCQEQNIDSGQIPMLYIESDDSFEEIDDFVKHCVNRYKVKLIKYKDSLKVALTQMTQDLPLIKAVFVGSRNTDPYCGNLKAMQKTDSDWPDMMRLNPLLEWSYHDIWHYIHMYKVPYCSLYSRGYTSIGYKSNTFQNPHLLCTECAMVVDAAAAPTSDAIATPCYRPAWELVDPTTERAGRRSHK